MLLPAAAAEAEAEAAEDVALSLSELLELFDSSTDICELLRSRSAVRARELLLPTPEVALGVADGCVHRLLLPLRLLPLSRRSLVLPPLLFEVGTERELLRRPVLPLRLRLWLWLRLRLRFLLFFFDFLSFSFSFSLSFFF